MPISTIARPVDSSRALSGGNPVCRGAPKRPAPFLLKEKDNEDTLERHSVDHLPATQSEEGQDMMPLRELVQIHNRFASFARMLQGR